MPTIKVSKNTYVMLEMKRRSMLAQKITTQNINKLRRVKVTFEDVIVQMNKDIEMINEECNGLIKQLQSLGKRPYWTEEEPL